ncbi:MAG: phage late control D family protein [Alphaproteobacteria bacterium]|nr:phage late control D family protein [Alphaproteobacteria bacterium]
MTTPVVDVRIDGRPQGPGVRTDLVEVVLDDHLELVGSARLTWALGRGVVVPELGTEVEVAWASGPRWRGRVTAWRLVEGHGPGRLVATALDARARLHAEVRSRAFEEATDGQIAARVLQEAGVEVGEVASTAPTHPHVLQRGETDLDFLRRLAARHGLAVVCREGRVGWTHPDPGVGPVQVDGDRLETFELGVDAQGVPAGLRVQGWDPRAGERVAGESSAADVAATGGGRHVLDVVRELGRSVRVVGDAAVEHADLARAVAVAELARLARGVVRGELQTSLLPDCLPGGGVRVRRLRPAMDVEGLIVGVTHRWGRGGATSTRVRFCSTSLPR